MSEDVMIKRGKLICGKKKCEKKNAWKWKMEKKTQLVIVFRNWYENEVDCGVLISDQGVTIIMC